MEWSWKKSKPEWSIKTYLAAVVTNRSLEIVFSKDKASLLTMAWAVREMEKKTYTEYETSTII